MIMFSQSYLPVTSLNQLNNIRNFTRPRIKNPHENLKLKESMKMDYNKFF